MERNIVENVDKTTDFYNYMFSMRRNLASLDALVKLLEKIPDNTNLSQDYCVSYMITFLRKYCKSDDDYELALASYGFLEEVSYKKYKSVQERTIEYWKHACKYEEHSFIRSSWTEGSALTTLKNRHIIIIGYLDEISQNVKNKNNGKLGLTKEVPKKLEFPEMRIIKELPAEQPCKTEASTFPTTVEDTPTNEEMPPNDIKNTQDDDSSTRLSQPVINLPLLEMQVAAIPKIVELIKSAQAPIACYDDSGKYDIDAIHHQIMNQIISNPFYGDMVMQGLLEVCKYSKNHAIVDSNTLLRFTAKTAEAMELPILDKKRGMNIWLTYAYKQVFPNEDYLYYARWAGLFLDAVPKCGVHKMQSMCNIKFNPYLKGDPVMLRAIQNDEQLTQEALILQYKTMGGFAYFTIGFCLEDGHFILYDKTSLIK